MDEPHRPKQLEHSVWAVWRWEWWPWLPLLFFVCYLIVPGTAIFVFGFLVELLNQMFG